METMEEGEDPRRMNGPDWTVLWDWNGTLLDDLRLSVRSANVLLARRGLPQLTHDAYLARFGFPVKDYYATIGFDFEREPFDDLSAEYVLEYEGAMGECSLTEGAVETLDRLSALGYRQAVLSASHLGFLDEALRRFGVRDRFVDIAGLDDKNAHGKTDVGRALVARLGARPDRTVLVGDTLHDCEVARALGCRPVLFTGGHQDRTRLAGCGAPVVDALADVVRVVEALRGAYGF
jgi:phosphoglycolate phosphatase